MSSSTNLVEDDTNDKFDIFLYDALKSTTTRITPNKIDNNCDYPRISGDGKWIAYYSRATNLVEDATSKMNKVYLYDVTKKITTIITPKDADGNSKNPSLSYDGRWVTYESNAKNIVENDENKKSDIFLYDALTKTTTMITPYHSNGSSVNAQITNDGKWIVYHSYTNNTVDTIANTFFDIFLFDVENNITKMITPPGTNGHSKFPVISDDAMKIAYQSGATNIISEKTSEKIDDIFLFTRTIETPEENEINNDKINDTINESTNKTINEYSKEITENNKVKEPKTESSNKLVKTLKNTGLPVNFIIILLITMVSAVFISKRK